MIINPLIKEEIKDLIKEVLKQNLKIKIADISGYDTPEGCTDIEVSLYLDDNDYFSDSAEFIASYSESIDVDK